MFNRINTEWVVAYRADKWKKIMEKLEKDGRLLADEHKDKLAKLSDMRIKIAEPPDMKENLAELPDMKEKLPSNRVAGGSNGTTPCSDDPAHERMVAAAMNEQIQGLLKNHPVGDLWSP